MTKKYDEETRIKKFWARVDIRGPDECWEWQGALNNTGYGTVGWGGTTVMVHRAAYALTHPETPMLAPKDRKGPGFALHSCDNRRCCNPAHISLGTYSENVQQAYDRGRAKRPRGPDTPLAKLSATQVQDIRRRFVWRSPRRSNSIALAREFGVSHTAIRKAALGETYTNVV